MKKIKIYIALLSGMITMGLNVYGQTTCPYPTDECSMCAKISPASFGYCTIPFVFDPTPYVSVPSFMSIKDWNWTGPGTVIPASGGSLTGPSTFSASGTYTYTIDAWGPNLINDGNFESWTPAMPCFSTSYALYLLIAFGSYQIGTNPAVVLPGLASMGDHTTGSGNMLMANCNPTWPTFPTSPVWEEDNIPVCSGTTYEFGAWYANLLGPPAASTTLAPQLQIEVRDASTGSIIYTSSVYSTPTVYGLWEPINFMLAFPASSPLVDIQIREVNPIGNKATIFALDDISLHRLCKTSGTFKMVPDAITGLSSVCVGSTISLSSLSGGSGAWSSSDPTIATVTPGTGIVTGVALGSVTITFVSIAGCTLTTTIIVNPIPDAGLISGPANVCVGSTISLSSSGDPGGIWSIAGGGTSIATVDGSGTVTGVSAGSAAIDYTVTNSCGSMTAIFTVTVDAPASPGVITSGPTSVPVGSTGYYTLFGADPGGFWTFSCSGTWTFPSYTNTYCYLQDVASAPGCFGNLQYVINNSCGSFVSPAYVVHNF